MTDKEKEAIERCKQLIKVEHANWIGLSNQNAINIVLNLIEKVSSEFAIGKRQYEQLIDDYDELNLKNINQQKELEKKDKMIDEMARMLVEVPNSVSDEPMTAVAKAMINRDLELHKRQVINYVRNKVESGDNK